MKLEFVHDDALQETRPQGVANAIGENNPLLRSFVLEHGLPMTESSVYSVAGVISKFSSVSGIGEITLLKKGAMSNVTLSFHLASVFTKDRLPRGPMAGDPVEVVFDLQRNTNMNFEVRRLRLPEGSFASS